MMGSSAVVASTIPHAVGAALAAKQLDCEIIDLNCISAPDPKLIVESVDNTGRLLIADTS